MKTRRFCLRATILISLFGSGSALGQSSWIVPVKVVQAGNTGVDTFGIAFGATYCSDLQLGETELPPKPPAGIFDIRFVDSREGSSCLGMGQRLHLQGSGLDTFRLAFQPGDPVGTNAWRVSWPAGLRGGWSDLILTDALGLGLFNVDMLADTSVTITQPFITAVNIIGRDVIEDVEYDSSPAPHSFSLGENYPNPFNPSTSVRFALAKAAPFDVAIYDLLGRRVATLASEELPPGFYSKTWSGFGDSGLSVPSGVYLLRMVATGEGGVRYAASQKLTLMK